eukprot:1332454-Amorphochlora_amoeboformis.AAC.1
MIYRVQDSQQKRMGAYFYIDTEDEVDDDTPKFIPKVTEKKEKKTSQKTAKGAKGAKRGKAKN